MASVSNAQKPSPSGLKPLMPSGLDSVLETSHRQTDVSIQAASSGTDHQNHTRLDTACNAIELDDTAQGLQVSAP